MGRGRGGREGLETAHLWKTQAPWPVLLEEVEEGGRVVFLLSFFVLCFFDLVILDVPSVQLDGAAVLVGFFSAVVLLARAHQAVQEVS